MSPAAFPARLRHSAVALAALLMACASHAGRPLATEDSGTNEPGSCHVESWAAHEQGETSGVISPACGIAEGLEIALEWSLPRHASRSDSSRGVALKWGPEAAQWGGWQWAAKLALGSERLADESRWRDGAVTLLGIGSKALSDQWAVHVNLGVDVAHRPHEQTAVGAAALVWTPHPRWLAFAELLGQEGSAVVRGASVRYWLLQDVLGLDATVHRHGGQSGSAYTLGLGWYGLRF